MAASSTQPLTIYLLPGPLGIGIKMSTTGECIVSSKAPQSKSPLQVGDILLSLNGISLVDVDGGTDAWCKLFSAFDNVERKVKVQRDNTAVINKKSIKNEKKVHLLQNDSSVQGNANKKRKADSNGSNKSNMEVISLIDDTDDEENIVEVGQKKVSTLNVGVPSRSSLSSLDDVEVMEVSPSSAPSWGLNSSSSSLSSGGNLKDDRNYEGNNNTNNNSGDINEDEELVVVASRGQNALADFPHSRENCVTHPFSGDKKKHCGNCYCYVCDSPAKDCKVWASHCQATHNDPHWKSEREKAKQARIRAASVAAAAPQPAAVSRSSSSSSLDRRRGRRISSNNKSPSAEFSVSKLLKEITVVHPVELQPPIGSGFVTTLRHYQKQSLAFMVDTEKNHLRGGWLADEVGMGKSAIVLALVASNQASPKSLAKEDQINDVLDEFEHREAKKKQIGEANKEAIAKLRDEYKPGEQDESIEDEKDREREYWKRCHKFDWEARKEDQKMKKEINQIPPIKERVKLKPTIILTSVSLIGQWEDEAKRHSPGLVVKTFHNSRSKEEHNIKIKDQKVIRGLNNVDVIISSSTFKWPQVITQCFDFHRVVHDESHLLVSSGASAKLSCVNLIQGKLRWGVTATPATSSVRDLDRQLEFIRLGHELSSPFGSHVGSNPSAIELDKLKDAISFLHRYPDEETFNRLASLLKTFMVRHTKSQRINGSEALALPPSTTSTVMLTMFKDEDEAFNHINSSARTFSDHCEFGVNAFTAQNAFCYQMSSLRKRNERAALSSQFSNKKPNIENEELLERVPGKGKLRYRYKPECLAKVVALRKDLSELQKTEPALRAVVFTQYLDLHEASVRGLEQDGFEVFQFTGSSKTKSRDDAIRKFQDTTNGKPAVFVITLRSGNVGITLTAASRVYLLEPSLDPAVEVQAAGRIHRLGQNKPCHVVKFAFKNSYEENVIELHKKILAGDITIVDHFVPSKAMRILAKVFVGSMETVTFSLDVWGTCYYLYLWLMFMSGI